MNLSPATVDAALEVARKLLIGAPSPTIAELSFARTPEGVRVVAVTRSDAGQARRIRVIRAR